MSKKIVLKNVRLSWHYVHKPRPDAVNDDGSVQKGKYTAKVLLKKGGKEAEATLEALKALCAEAVTAKWGAKPPKIKPEKMPYQDGDYSNSDWEEGHHTVASSEWPERKILVVGRKNEVLTEDSGLPYMGCYVNLMVSAYAYDNKSQGVALNLKALQFVRDGEVFGEQTISAEDAFDVLDDDETSEDDIFG